MMSIDQQANNSAMQIANNTFTAMSPTQASSMNKRYHTQWEQFAMDFNVWDKSHDCDYDKFNDNVITRMRQ